MRSIGVKQEWSATLKKKKCEWDVQVACWNNHSLLVFNVFKCHQQINAKQQQKLMETNLAIIPGGMVSVFQPLDVNIHEPFKLLVHKSLSSTGWIWQPEFCYMAMDTRSLVEHSRDHCSKVIQKNKKNNSALHIHWIAVNRWHLF